MVVCGLMRPSFLLRQAIHLCLQLQERSNALKLPNHMFCAYTNRFIDVALVHFRQETLDSPRQVQFSRGDMMNMIMPKNSSQPRSQRLEVRVLEMAVPQNLMEMYAVASTWKLGGQQYQTKFG